MRYCPSSKQMKRTRLGLFGLLVVALLSVAVEPVAAQSINERMITNLNQSLLYVAIPITVLVEAILIYTVVKYRNNDDPQPTRENRRLEITWTITTAIILLFVGLASFVVLANDASPTNSRMIAVVIVHVISSRRFSRVGWGSSLLRYFTTV